MAESVINSFFPSQVASDAEKMSEEYGLRVGRAIQDEWFKSDSGTTRFRSNQNTFHRLRLYSRGEQSIQKYKDELSINGDLSYLNIDCKPEPIIHKFVDIVVNGISGRSFDIKAYSQDPYGVYQRSEYLESIIRDIQTKEINEFVQAEFGINLFENKPETLPESKEELELHMQLTYKQAVELAEEQAINVLLDGNNYDLTRKRVYYDLTTIGIGAVKNRFSKAEGITVEYVDPANLVWSYTESPYFDDIYYVGEVRDVHINELKKQFPNLTNEDLNTIAKTGYQNNQFYDRTITNYSESDSNTVQVLYFNYKTYMNEVYKVKETATGATKILMRDDTFDPPVEVLEQKFGKMSRSLEVLYEGVLILGTDYLLRWELAKNMMRPKSDETKVLMHYSMCAPRIYKGKIESLVSRITGFADMIQLTHLKLQQVMSRMVPDGVYLDADGLAEVDLGNGTNYNPQEALNMFFQTGSVIGRSFTQDGDMNPGKIPIQEITSGSGGNKLQSLISTYNYYLQMIRDVTGLNEARDASTPDSRSLVGIQKIAAANSNTATRHILDGGLYITSHLAECLSLRISDVIEFGPTKEAFIQKIGGHNVGTLEEMSTLHMRDFGSYIEMEPDEEEKQKLENNIQTALSAGLIDLDDAIDIRQIQNLKLANQVLKLRRKKKAERDQMMQQQNIQAQAQANAQAQQVAAQAEIQKKQALMQSDAQLEQIKNDLEIQKLQAEVEAKKELMAQEFQYNIQLKGLDGAAKAEIQAQKDTAAGQREAAKSESFESSGNDIIGGGINLGTFEPK